MPKAPLFIIGYPRSGTTLLRAILGSHSQIALCNEPELIGGLRSAGFQIGDYISKRERGQLLERLGASGACRRHLSSLPAKTLSHFIQQERDLSFKETYELLLPRPTGATVWGEKSLNNVFRIRDICSLYPDAVIVHIVRDPKAALLSYYRKRFAQCEVRTPEFERRAIHFFLYRILQWCTWVAAVREAHEALSKHILQVRFEDLIKSPASEIARICLALEIGYEARILDPRFRNEDSVLVGDTAYAHKRLREPINSLRANSGKELPPWASYIIERYAQHTLESLGYALTHSTVGVLARIRLLAELKLVESRMRAKLYTTVTNRLGYDFQHLVP